MKQTPYQNARATFLKSNRMAEAAHAKIGVVGIPYDGSTSYRPGARMAPAAICDVSAMLTDGCHPRYGIDPSEDLADCGDIITGNDHAASMEEIADWYARSDFVQDGRPMFAMGGDHSITAGILAGFKSAVRLPPDTKVLIFDAHCDVWESDFGLPRGHGTWLRNVVEDGLVKPENIMQVAVRSPVDPITRDWLANAGGRHISPYLAETNHTNSAAADISLFTCRGRPLYVSIDIDVLDPAFAPGTGTPECGGLSTMSLLRLLNEIHTRDLIGVDVVEVNPAYDPTKITALAGATALYTLMSRYLKEHQ